MAPAGDGGAAFVGITSVLSVPGSSSFADPLLTPDNLPNDVGGPNLDASWDGSFDGVCDGAAGTCM